MSLSKRIALTGVLLALVVLSVFNPEPAPQFEPTPTNTEAPTDAEPEPTATETQEPVLKWVAVNVSGLRLRSTPQAEGDVLAVLVSGDSVPVFAEQDGWYEVQFIVFRGWIKAEFTVEVEHIPSEKNTAARAQAQSKVGWEVDCDNVDPFDGYYYRGDCIPGVISADTNYTTYPANSIGGMAHYAEGVMEEVAKRKGMSLEGYVDGVALESCGYIGKSVFLKVKGQWYGPFLVVDCSARFGTYANVVYNSLIVEVGYKFYNKMFNEGKWTANASVVIGGTSNSEPIDFKTYWINRAEYVHSLEEMANEGQEQDGEHRNQ